jgi:hypothetical protein
MADRTAGMPLNLIIMGLLGLIAGGLGLPVLARPEATRRLLGLKNTPQMTYILRITGTMLAALGLILIVFAAAFWSAQG